MGRWEPDARGRLMRAALELFADGGFERATVADLAERAGVTERTFFRHFADKREVLFDGAAALQEAVVAAIAGAPAGRAPAPCSCAVPVSGAVCRRSRARNRQIPGGARRPL